MALRFTLPSALLWYQKYIIDRFLTEKLFNALIGRVAHLLKDHSYFERRVRVARAFQPPRGYTGLIVRGEIAGEGMRHGENISIDER